jgi:hypothetical protein
MVLTLHPLHLNTSVSRGEKLLIVHTVHYGVHFCNEINAIIIHDSFQSLEPDYAAKVISNMHAFIFSVNIIQLNMKNDRSKKK